MRFPISSLVTNFFDNKKITDLVRVEKIIELLKRPHPICLLKLRFLSGETKKDIKLKYLIGLGETSFLKI